MKKLIMKRAWEIAKEGQKDFGGKVSEYLSVSMKMAWAESRKATVNTTTGSKNHKSWVALITGKNARFGYARKFVEPVEENSFDGKILELNNGVYQVCNAGDRKFIQVVNGQIVNIDESEVAA